MADLTDFAFEIGKVYLKVELSKQQSGQLLKERGAPVDERIVLQKIGKFWNQQNMWDRPDGLVVITTHRLVFLSKLKSVTVTTDFLSFPFSAMANLRTTRIMGMSPAIAFETEAKPYVFTLLTGAEEVAAAINQQRAA